MIKNLVVMVSSVVFFSACSSSNNVCEDLTLASEQVQQCQSLHKQIINDINKIVSISVIIVMTSKTVFVETNKRSKSH
jgi:hypothetical protein